METQKRMFDAFRALLAALVMFASTAAVAAPADLTVLFTGDNGGEIEPCG